VSSEGEEEGEQEITVAAATAVVVNDDSTTADAGTMAIVTATTSTDDDSENIPQASAVVITTTPNETDCPACRGQHKLHTCYKATTTPKKITTTTHKKITTTPRTTTTSQKTKKRPSNSHPTTTNPPSQPFSTPTITDAGRRVKKSDFYSPESSKKGDYAGLNVDQSSVLLQGDRVWSSKWGREGGEGVLGVTSGKGKWEVNWDNGEKTKETRGQLRLVDVVEGERRLSASSFSTPKSSKGKTAAAATATTTTPKSTGKGKGKKTMTTLKTTSHKKISQEPPTPSVSDDDSSPPLPSTYDQSNILLQGDRVWSTKWGKSAGYATIDGASGDGGTELSVTWDGGEVTREKMRNLKLMDEGEGGRRFSRLAAASSSNNNTETSQTQKQQNLMSSLMTYITNLGGRESLLKGWSVKCSEKSGRDTFFCSPGGAVAVGGGKK